MLSVAGGWELAGVFNAQSGQPYTALVSSDLNNDLNSRNERAPGTSRNQFRLPAIYTVDPRITRNVNITERAKLQLIAEAFNLFISLFKATTIVSLIAVPDLMYNVSMVTQQEMRPLPLYTGAALTYFLIIFVLASVVRAFSERWRHKILA